MISSLLAVFFKSITTLTSAADSSRTSTMPSIFLSILMSSIFLTSKALFVSNGISVITSDNLPFSSSNVYLLLMLIFPRPVV